MDETSAIDEQIRYYHSILAQLRASYEKAAEPYLRRILNLQAMKPRPMMIDAETYAMIISAPSPTPPKPSA